jgi:osmotically-inducible protein OsmY
MGATSDLRTAVKEALRVDPALDPDDIEVDVMNGDVLLNGTVPSKAQCSEATMAAQGVAGVGTVHNLLEVALPSDDYGNDTALSGLAMESLTAAATVPAGITAMAREGTVYLTGTVSNSAERAAAENAVAGVGGVLGITNEIVVRGEAP